jgi:SAM-dependent methyltransferase
MSANPPDELRRIYCARFEKNLDYRKSVWEVLVPQFFQKYVPPSATVLDLGCGYGEFINTVLCGRKLAMDLNPDAPRFLASEVHFLQQDCSARWQCDDSSLDLIFTSNFFEHLPGKSALKLTLDECFRCLKPGGKLIAMGPNIRFLSDQYWDFWDHHLALSDRSLAEGLENCGFVIVENHDKFLPYTMVNSRKYPPVTLSLYLKVRPAWKIFGRQFLIVAAKA